MKYNYTQPANELQRFADMVEFPDAEPTENSAQLVTSGGVYDAIQAVEEEAKQLSYNSLMEDTAFGSIASFPDGAEGVPVKELTAEIEPIQDLHGQANAYPPAGGKQMLPLTESFLKAKNGGGTWSGSAYSYNGVVYTLVKDAAGNVEGININGTATTTSRFFLLAPADIASLLAADTNYTMSGKPNMTCAFQYTNNVDSAREDTGSGVTFQKYADTYTNQQMLLRIDTGNGGTNVMFKPMLCLASATDPTTFAPYSNICPISGYTGAEITRTGNNLCNWKINTTSADPLEIYLKPNTYRIEASAAIASGNWYVRMSNASGEYFANADMGLDGWSRASSGWAYGGAAATGVTFTVPSGCALVEIGKLNADGTIPAMLNIGSTTLPYEAYLGTTYSVSWTDHGTVYKGTATYQGDSTWKVVADYGSFNLGDTEGATVDKWATSGNAYRYYDGNIAVGDYTNDDNVISSYLPKSPTTTPPSNKATFVQSGSSTSHNIYVYYPSLIDPSITDLASFVAYLNLHPLRVVYKLTTPVEFTVTGPTPETLLGDNNMWTSTNGDISVKYRCNTAEFIDKRTPDAPDANGTYVFKAIVSGGVKTYQWVAE